MLRRPALLVRPGDGCAIAFASMSSDRPVIGALDGLRGLAALLVAAYHAWLLSGEAPLGGGALRDALSSGYFAASFFFVLSGFVLLWPVALRGGEFGSIRRYARRRIARIVPAYYVALAVGVVLLPLLFTRDIGIGDVVTPESLLAHLLLVHNEARLVPGYDGALGLGVNPAVWTLSVEWVFYCALPLIAAPFVRRPLVFLALAAVVAVGGRIALGAVELSQRNEALLLSSAPMHALDFAFGMAAACLVAQRRELLGTVPRARLVAGVAAVALVAIMAAVGGADGSVVRDASRASATLTVALPAVFAALVVALAFAPRGPLGGRVGRRLGEISFGVFLGHFIFIGLGRATLGLPVDGTTGAFLAMEAFVLGGALVYGALSWRFVEAPARRWARSADHVRGEVLRPGNALGGRAGGLDER